MSQKEDLPIVHATFVITGFDVEPQVITDVLGIGPDESGRAGDKRILANGKVLTLREGYWELKATPNGPSFYLQDYLIAILIRIEPFAAKLTSLPAGAARKILVQASVPESGSVPGLYLESAIIGRLAKLGVALEIDIN